MDPADAKWLHPLLQQVLQSRGNGSAEPVITEVQGVSLPDRMAQPRSGGAVGDGGVENADGLHDETATVEVQWPDVAELWSYDAHPVYGIRPSSYASLVLIQAWDGFEGRSSFLREEATSQGNQDGAQEATAPEDMGGTQATTDRAAEEEGDTVVVVLKGEGALRFRPNSTDQVSPAPFASTPFHANSTVIIPRNTVHQPTESMLHICEESGQDLTQEIRKGKGKQHWTSAKSPSAPFIIAPTRVHVQL
ncbi:unnamed protein product [Closterium sp. NIES-65]|nr:unnamed protein product [Closterium sp. NIES-65]